MRVVLLRRTADGKVGRDESLGSMKQKYEGKDLHGFGRPRSFAKGTDASWREEKFGETAGQR